MYYEINVAKKTKQSDPYEYRHHFATAPRSITDKDKLKEVYNELKAAFPEPEYKLSITHYKKTGEGIDPKELEN